MLYCRLWMPKQPLTIRLDHDTIECIRSLSEENGIPYQSLIDLHLRECAAENRKRHLEWAMMDNKPLQRTVSAYRLRAAGAVHHGAASARWTRDRAAAQQRR